MGLFGAIVIRPAVAAITAEDILAIPWEDGGAPGLTNGDAGMSLAEAGVAAAGGCVCIRQRRDARHVRPVGHLRRPPTSRREHPDALRDRPRSAQLHGAAHRRSRRLLNWKSYPEWLHRPLLPDQRPIDARHRCPEQRSVAARPAIRCAGARAAVGSSRQPARCHDPVRRCRPCRLRLPPALQPRARHRRRRRADEGARTATTTPRASSTSWSPQAGPSMPRSGGRTSRTTATPPGNRVPVVLAAGSQPPRG